MTCEWCSTSTNLKAENERLREERAKLLVEVCAWLRENDGPGRNAWMRTAAHAIEAKFKAILTG